MSAAAAERPRPELLIVLLVAAIQFINILDFVIPMPLGLDLAHGLGFGADQVGKLAGAYSAAAAVSGLLGSFFLDRFDRRKVVAVSMFGLVVGTAAGGFAHGLGSLMAARIVAGVFGGPATSASFSIVADVVPVERRGAALSKVTAAFSAAQVLGVPLSLELARRFTWSAPFFVTAGAGLVVVALAVAALPPIRGHLQGRQPASVPEALREVREIVRRRDVQWSYLTTATVMAGGFILIPNISPYVQENLGYPREHLQYLYAAGGAASFVVMPFVGRLVDRYGSFWISVVGAGLLTVTVYFGFIHYPAGLPVMALYVAFMSSTAFRNVAYNTLASRVPQPAWRARFMSLQSTVQHLASTLGANLSTALVVESADHRTLQHIEVVAALCIAINLCVPPLVRVVETRVNARRELEIARRSALAPS